MAAIKNKIGKTARHMPKTSRAYAGTERKGKKVGNMEKGLKMEEIDRIIAESILDTCSVDIHLGFMENLKILEAALEEDGAKNSGLAAMFLSCIMTAQANAINTMRGVLYRLFCGEEETKTGNGDSKQYRYRGNEDVFNK